MSIFDYTFLDNGSDNFHLPYSIDNTANFLPTCSYPPIPRYILRSNLLPSQMDVVQTNYVLQVESEELRRYDEEIQRLRLILESTEAERDMLYRKMQERRSWFAPIRRLPVEILGRILVEVVKLSEFSLEIDPYDATEIHAIPLRLSHVSYHWRSLTFSHKSIWSSINLGIHRMEKDFTPLLDIYLTNSVDHPLTISIRDFEAHLPDQASSTAEELEECLGLHTSSFLRRLTDQFPRCQELTLWALQPGHLLQEEASFLLLRKLSLSLSSEPVPVAGHDINGTNHFWNAIRDAPALEYVTTHSGLLDIISISIDHLRWDRLKTLCINDLAQYTEFRFVITHCRQLEELQIGAWLDDPDWNEGVEPQVVVLPYVRKLELSGDIHFMLGSLTLPSLRIAQLGMGYRGVNSTSTLDSVHRALQDFLSLLQRSSRTESLTELHLTNMPLAFSIKWFTTLLRILEHSSYLEHLKVSMGRSYEPEATNAGAGDVSFIASLFSLLLLPSSHSRAFLPRLNDIELHEHRDFSPQFLNSILEMVEERTRPSLDTLGRMDVSALRNVLICTRRKFGCWKTREHPLPAIQEGMAVLKRNGTSCCISSDFDV
ncbi:hypothetical protein VNI00_017214 [Paramarasmius palmivorus]|uniref:F-box domain-containing protein n=1 Tax=Paramarasmius palmivorus TaxID=297713 RepID=A0AAW0B805_9AGAR